MAVETMAPEPVPAEKVVVAEATAETIKETQEKEEDLKKTVTTSDDQSVSVAPSPSFKEESNMIADLSESEKKALDELKELIKAAVANNEFNPVVVSSSPSPAKTTPEKNEKLDNCPTPPVSEEKTEDDGAKTVAAVPESVVSKQEDNNAAAGASEAETKAAATVDEKQEEIFVWGVPLIGDERSDTVLLKFLRARDFKAKEAMTMIKNSVLWRKEFDIESLIEQDLDLRELSRVVFMHGKDKENHPVCYNVLGEFQDKELYAKAFGDEEKCNRFLKWRTQFLEMGIRKLLDFSPGGISTMVQVTDLRNSPVLAKREVRQATNQALALLQDNYPEFVAKQIFINVPWWYLAFNVMISPFLTQRTKSKFIFAGPSKTADTLFRYIAPEQVPVTYGGLSHDEDSEFTIADSVTEITVKPSSKEVVEIPVSEECVLLWELRVVGWEVVYGAEFVPNSENSYTVIVQKAKKYIASDEPVLKNSFKVGEPGKVVLTIDNTNSKKKKLLFRSKIKSSAE